MKLLVLGATGNTGIQVVEQALQRGHSVVAVVRSPGKVTPRPNLTVIEGDVTKVEDLAAAMAGVDAVIGTLGPRDLKPTTIYSDSTRALIAAMKQSGVKRMIMVTAALLFDMKGLVPRFLGWLLRNGMSDARRLEALVRDSGLEWTIVRPPRLTNKKLIGRYREAVDALPENGGVISRADTAHWLLETAEHAAHRQQLVGIAY